MLKIEQFTKLGILFIIIGFAILFFSQFMFSKDTTSKTKVAIGGFIGPIPFGFGNDKNLLLLVILLSIALIVYLFFINFGKAI